MNNPPLETRLVILYPVPDSLLVGLDYVEVVG
jgi:hypothetical protein